MDVLESLTPDQRTLIVSLPYRAGLWVSQSDDSGGDEADQKELTALDNILHGFSEQVFGSELLQYVMSETVSRKAEWDGWGENLERLPMECEQALDILRAYVDEKEVSAYSTRLMEIAEAVALAFREYEEGSAVGRVVVYCSYAVMRLKSILRKQPSKSFDQFLSISASERKALGALASALGSHYTL